MGKPRYFFCYVLFFLFLSPAMVLSADLEGFYPPMEIESELLAPPKIAGMVFVKGGCFDMGDTFGDGDDNEKPVHRVCVDDFYIDKYEVTQAEWQGVMGNNPSFKNCGGRCPVENVSWYDVQEYIKKLNRKSGRKYRLPTEAEWEYAARSGGKRQRFAGFSDESGLYRYANFCDSNCEFTWKARGQDDGYEYTSPVGSFRPNGLGLYDMTGNVWEWVSDWYDEKYHRKSPSNNPKGPSGGSSRVGRGGSWRDWPRNVGAARRYILLPSYGYGIVGFRLVVGSSPGR